MSHGSSLRNRARLAAVVLLMGCASVGHAQVTVERGPAALTVEGYANLTAGIPANESSDDVVDDEDNPRVDAALRGLLRWSNDAGPDIGIRAVIESTPEDELDVAEASLLILGSGGRLEIGERQGLPDVLLGYAPNNFTFTGAEFGPASGLSLDPGGGLPTAFLEAGLAGQIRELSVLGFAATLSDDRSSKVLYVSPKRHGWLAGASYASDATDPRFDELVQAGITHDTYWADNVLHVGGSYSHADANHDSDAAQRNLRSLNVGGTLVLNYDLMLGASVSYDGSSGLSGSPPSSGRASDAWGAVISVNYNRGPWTIGGFAQRSTHEGAPDESGNDALTALEAGLSYRLSTKVRLYGAWYYFAFDDEGGSVEADRHRGNLLIVGLRATL